jgi:hypothetical protein
MAHHYCSLCALVPVDEALVGFSFSSGIFAAARHPISLTRWFDSGRKRDRRTKAGPLSCQEPTPRATLAGESCRGWVLDSQHFDDRSLGPCSMGSSGQSVATNNTCHSGRSQYLIATDLKNRSWSLASALMRPSTARLKASTVSASERFTVA